MFRRSDKLGCIFGGGACIRGAYIKGGVLTGFYGILNLRCRTLAFTSYKKETPTQVLSLEFSKIFNGALSGLRQFLATESPLKMMKNGLYLTFKSLFLLKIFEGLS